MKTISKISLAFLALLLVFNVSVASDKARKSKANTWNTFAKEAERLIADNELEEAGELLNTSIKIKRTVKNLTLKGDQYAKAGMNTNAIYFYQKALEEGIRSEKHFDVEPLQVKILAANPTKTFLEAKGDHKAFGEAKEATHSYVKALELALASQDMESVKRIQGKIRAIN